MTEETRAISETFPEISGYKTVALLGEGGMGAVYLAEDVALGRKVAIKLISEKIISDSMARDRFLREARTMATIEHPNVVRIYSFGEHKSQPYFVMEYVEGESLSARIRKRGRMSSEESLQILRQIAEALGAAWKKGIIHRDIKPSNILIDRSGKIRVADFGLAKPLLGGDVALTSTGLILGSPLYISPEQGRGETLDFRSDMYSLGIVFYEMLAGVPPFDGKTPLSVIAKHLTEPLPPLRPKRPDIGENVHKIVEKLTNKNPSERYDSYEILLAEIEKSSKSSVPAPAERKKSRGALWLTAAIVLVAVIALALVARHKRQAEKPPPTEEMQADIPAESEIPPSSTLAEEPAPPPPLPPKSRPSSEPVREQPASAPPAEKSPSETAPRKSVLKTLVYDFRGPDWHDDWEGLTQRILNESRANQKLVLTGDGAVLLKKKFKGDIRIIINGDIVGYLSDGHFSVLANWRSFDGREGYAFVVAKGGGVRGEVMERLKQFQKGDKQVPQIEPFTANILKFGGWSPDFLSTKILPAGEQMRAFNLTASAEDGTLSFDAPRGNICRASDNAFKNGRIGFEVKGWQVHITKLQIEYRE